MSTTAAGCRCVESGLKNSVFCVEPIPVQLPGASAITAMAVSGGKVYAGLTGLSRVLVEIEPATGTVRDLGPIYPTENKTFEVGDKIHNSLVVDSAGRLIIGQGLNINWSASPHQLDLHRWGGGHVFRYDPASEKLEDLGLAVPLNAIHGLTIDRERNVVSGYTIPDNHFFRFDLNSGRCEDYGKISPYASHNLVTAPNGDVYGGWYVDWQGTTVAMAPSEPPPSASDQDPAGQPAPPRRRRAHGKFPGTYLFRFSLAEGRIDHTDQCLVFNSEIPLFANVGIDSWIATRGGRVFGATVMAGRIFEVLWQDDSEVRHAGTPIGLARLSGMAEDADGIIWGTGGMPHMHLFSFDPETGAMTDHGPVVTSHPMCYFHGIVVTDDGTIWTGETDSGRSIVYKITRR